MDAPYGLIANFHRKRPYSGVRWTRRTWHAHLREHGHVLVNYLTRPVCACNRTDAELHNTITNPLPFILRAPVLLVSSGPWALYPTGDNLSLWSIPIVQITMSSLSMTLHGSP